MENQTFFDDIDDGEDLYEAAPAFGGDFSHPSTEAVAMYGRSFVSALSMAHAD
jgi:hypothetical protein